MPVNAVAEMPQPPRAFVFDSAEKFEMCSLPVQQMIKLLPRRLLRRLGDRIIALLDDGDDVDEDFAHLTTEVVALLMRRDPEMRLLIVESWPAEGYAADTPKQPGNDQATKPDERWRRPNDGGNGFDDWPEGGYDELSDPADKPNQPGNDPATQHDAPADAAGVEADTPATKQDAASTAAATDTATTDASVAGVAADDADEAFSPLEGPAGDYEHECSLNTLD